MSDIKKARTTIIRWLTASLIILVIPLALAASGQEGKKVQPDTELQGRWKDRLL